MLSLPAFCSLSFKRLCSQHIKLLFVCHRDGSSFQITADDKVTGFYLQKGAQNTFLGIARDPLLSTTQTKANSPHFQGLSSAGGGATWQPLARVSIPFLLLTCFPPCLLYLQSHKGCKNPAVSHMGRKCTRCTLCSKALFSASASKTVQC